MRVAPLSLHEEICHRKLLPLLPTRCLPLGVCLLMPPLALTLARPWLLIQDAINPSQVVQKSVIESSLQSIQGPVNTPPSPSRPRHPHRPRHLRCPCPLRRRFPRALRLDVQVWVAPGARVQVLIAKLHIVPGDLCTAALPLLNFRDIDAMASQTIQQSSAGLPAPALPSCCTLEYDGKQESK